MKSRLHFLLVPLLFTGLAYFYLLPGTAAMVEGRTDVFMSDGTDATTLPYIYDVILKIWREHPSRYFYGSLYTEGIDPERGIATWMPWSERWLVLFQSNFFPVEQTGTAMIASLMVINALCMYLLCLYLGWTRSVSLALGLAWGFCTYTRARAKVHGALVGIYHLPLIFLGLSLVVKGKSKRSLFLAMLALLLAGTTAHYYLVTSLFLSPFFVAYVLLHKEFREDWRRVSLRFVAAMMPLLLFLGWNFKFAVPSDAKLSSEESMLLKPLRPGEVDPFLNIYYAHPVDFLGGDISLQLNGFDLNPLRAGVNRYIFSNLGESNPHERTNGIRWLILGLATAAVVSLARGKFSGNERRLVVFFLIFGVFMFWQATGPMLTGAEFNPSYWLFQLCSKIRVSSRAGVNVHFALIMLAGYFLSTSFKGRKYFVYPGLLAGLMILDYPPLQPVPMSPIQPVYSALQRDRGPCGTGMAFPFFNPYIGMLDMYNLAQRMRGSDCSSLNQLTNMNHVQWLTEHFPPNGAFLSGMPQNVVANAELERIAKCVPLNWLVFHDATPRDWAMDFCRRLGWQFNPEMTCVAPDKNQPLKQFPETCL